ncbi:MAG: transporter substrate-binding domain-containing protein [Pseudodesulfovibrio sp.]|uniref:Extracellular solute-binding protein family 3 n=1 Tax=Pseudodesulfovibrio aespoeensis (strain ATCC 700646 / DSM 10631 / Aspo-2) TaxID=643562 RepID=E6VY46_PSEA9|nr:MULTISPECIES: transporter substrate-binding domain-containing protein [Pseudodesulfovibrio]MBU4193144.1 transporter substrate-binding domain-containing protein [Pseudomonadota bacterium]ADU63860.1 extracellular solute-binding protein family 3 [Pseudodesulfovibrio aespoeensis Aspo-2]MBU4243794.1 transporter substrate-binding domain-containing protein [Pseudomonadota bacterium]MBU4378570.1 transporter substrate-binding domain-containing protein [Pseudomonadota bacterium]MBU4475265.1 transport
MSGRLPTLFLAFFAILALPGLLAPPCLTAQADATSPVDQPGQMIIAHDAGYPPFCFLDQDGEPTGYLIDLWRAFGRENDIEITFLLGTWQQSLDMVMDGRADVHGGLVHSNDRDRVFDFGPELIELSTHLFVRNGFDARQTQPVGVVRGGYEEDFMRANRPTTRLVLFDDNMTMVRAATDGHIPAFVADSPTVSYCLGLYGARSDFAVSDLIYRKPLQAAVCEGRHDTLDLVNYGWARMDQKTLTRIHGKWFLDTANRPPWLLGGMLIAGLALVLAFAIRGVTKRLHD